MNKGHMEGRIEERKSTMREAIRNLMESLNMTAEQAMDALKIDKDERARYMV